MSIHFLLQYLKNPKNGPNWRAKRGNLPHFLNNPLLQNIKKLKKELSKKDFSKKVSQCQKAERGPFSLSRYCMLRGKRGKNFHYDTHAGTN